MKKKIMILTTIAVIIIVLITILVITLTSTNEDNIIKLNYNEITEKVNNKESFVLCISASNCPHCKSYKRKIKKIANEYNMIIYYTDIDKLSEKEYEEFKTKFSFDGSTPTTVFFKEGEEKTTATRIEGDTQTEKIINKLKQNGFISQ